MHSLELVLGADILVFDVDPNDHSEGAGPAAESKDGCLCAEHGVGNHGVGSSASACPAQDGVGEQRPGHSGICDDLHSSSGCRKSSNRHVPAAAGGGCPERAKRGDSARAAAVPVVGDEAKEE